MGHYLKTSGRGTVIFRFLTFCHELVENLSIDLKMGATGTGRTATLGSELAMHSYRSGVETSIGMQLLFPLFGHRGGYEYSRTFRLRHTPNLACPHQRVNEKFAAARRA